MQFVVSLLILLCVVTPRSALGEALERGVAVTDPHVLRELDGGRFSLGRMIEPAGPPNAPMTNDALFALPSMALVGRAIDEEFERYIGRHNAAVSGQTIGVGTSFDVQLFDRAALHSKESRFLLVGIINRMDRAYASPDSCGEVRLIYRLTRVKPMEAGEGSSPRLPMTLNVVLKAKGDHAAVDGGVAITCSEIARRWLAAGDSALVGAELAAELISRNGPLDLIRPQDIDRIETDLQIAHTPKSARRDFRTDYLLQVFRLDPQTRVFEQAPLENQIDREKIFADAGLKRQFSAWLLEPKNLAELDRGTILIPEKFLASSAIAATPVGFAPSNRQPAFGFVQADGYGNEVFGEGEVVAALKKAASRGVALENIRSVAGFERRLNDITCAGCHQTRGVGGFHFPGVGWMEATPSGSTGVAASPHFFGDQIRRRDIVAALRDGVAPDYSRGFSARPQLRGSTALAGTEYEDGWGAHCYVQKPKLADNDPSFRSWNCAEALACQPVANASGAGMCFVKSR